MDSTFKNIHNGETKMADQKLNSNVNLGEIRYLGVRDITDYELVDDSEIPDNGSSCGPKK